MISYSLLQQVAPVVESQVNTQLSLYGEVWKHLISAIHKLCTLNIQAGKTLADETTTNIYQLLATKNVHDFVLTATAQVQPIAEKARAYQQHVNNIALGTQVDVARTTDAHLSQTTRTTELVAEESAQKGAEEIQKMVENDQKIAAQAAPRHKSSHPDGAREEHATDHKKGNKQNHDGHTASPLLGALMENISESRH